jgi:hypothetical protein
VAISPWFGQAAEMSAAFEAARQSLSSTPTLDHPAAWVELSLVTDASTTHMGTVIQQKWPGQDCWPLGFLSSQLDRAQGNYSGLNRELFAVLAAIRQLSYMIVGRSFFVLTDHRPLVGALSRRSDPWTGRQQCQLSFIAEFSPMICHKAGQSDVVVDTLSSPAGDFSSPHPLFSQEMGASPPAAT